MEFDFREVIRWAVLFLFVLLVAWILDGIALPVFTWLGQIVDQAVGLVAKPSIAELAGDWFAHFGMTAVHFAAGGFAYAWLVHVPWKKGASMAWLCFMALRYLPVIHLAVGSLAFYVDAFIGLAAAFGGAYYYADEWQYNEHFVGLRRRLHDRLQLA